MPISLFQCKDYLNYRYFHKRAYYLACLATGIEESNKCTFSISYTYQNDNDLQPVIIIDPGQGEDDFSKSKCRVRIILAIDGNVFPISKTLPNKNNVRKGPDPEALKDHASVATPFYNASLRSECTSMSYLKLLHGASLQSDGFADACVLGSTWLRQRGFASGLRGGGFGPFEWASTTALLLQGGGLKGKPALSKGYSAYQMFKAVLHYLSVRDLVASPLYLHSSTTYGADAALPMLFDGLRGMNTLFKMTPWSYAMLRHEAGRTLQLLSDPLADHFDACFISNVHQYTQRFDCVVTMPVTQSPALSEKPADALEHIILFCHLIYKALKHGLADRINLMSIELPSKIGIPLRSSEKLTKEHYRVQIGLLLNPEKVNRSVDHGPSAEDKKSAADFRKFWGEKAELRRFKDGSIQESLIWTPDTWSPILTQIILYLIHRHMGDDAAKGLTFVGQAFDHLLESQRGATSDAITIYQPAMNACETLEKDIRSLEGLPLQIRQVSPADPQLRFSSTNIPNLDSHYSQMRPANVYVQFEGSARWPDDLEAVQMTKIAFLLKIGELLEEAVSNLTARLGLENTQYALLNTAFLDVFYPTGAFFRLRIHHERELNLLQRTLREKAYSAVGREETAAALSAYKRNFIQAPLHTQAVRTLSTRFPLFSPCMRLLKKWRDCHLLSHHISDELIELLTVHTFVHPSPWSVPGSVMTGFLRTLTFIAKWDWHNTPLIVDFNDEMSVEEIESINVHFEAWRKIDPAMNRVAVFAASNIDPDGISWTETGPSKVIAARFTGLAKAACAKFIAQGLELRPDVLFAGSTEDYDFVVHLNQQSVQQGHRKGVERGDVFKNLRLQGQDKSLLGFNPVQSYMAELRTLYGSSVLFFHNEQSGRVIAGLWNPQTGSRPWKIGLQYSTMPKLSAGHDQPQVTINKSATLHDIAKLGGDLVSRVEVKQ